jgi:hypothetical protein
MVEFYVANINTKTTDIEKSRISTPQLNNLVLDACNKNNIQCPLEKKPNQTIQMLHFHHADTEGIL